MSTGFTPNYSERMSAAREGMLADMEPKSFISRTVENEAGIGFGKAVFQGVADKGATGVVDIAAAAGKFVGISVRERGVRASSPNGFARYDSLRAIRFGNIHVKVDGAVKAGDPVRVRANGDFGTGGTGFVIPGARFETSTEAAGLAVVHLS